MIRLLRSLSIGILLFSSTVSLRASDADLAAFWDFESGRRDADLWTVSLHGQGATPNCYDELGGTKLIAAKNAFFRDRLGMPTLSVVRPADEGIPHFDGEHVLKATVFNDEQAYLDFAASMGQPSKPHGSNVKARIDPGVPMRNFRLGNGESAWFGFALYIPEDYIFETAAWGTESIGELQYREDIPAGASAKGGPFGLAIGAGILHVHARYSPTDNPKDSTERIDVEHPLTRGSWHTIVCHVRLDFSPHGFAEVWIDGTKIMDAHNVRVGYAGLQGAKTALDVMTNYKHNWWAQPASTIVTPDEQFARSLYFDALRVAPVGEGSYADVEPRPAVASPAAKPVPAQEPSRR